MTTEEEAATLAEWETNAAKPSSAKATLVDSIIADPNQLAALKAALAK
jgi:DNA-binding transcriptional regulator YiaG